MRIDLHTHTTMSDGTYTPSEIVDLAIESDIAVLSITDHDTINGVEEAVNYAKDKGIIVVPGIELSGSTNNKEEIHILGYFLDINNEELKKELENIVINRVDRNTSMVQRFNDIGIKMNYQDIIDETKGDGTFNTVTRGHFASFLVREGYASDRDEAMNKYLKQGCETFVSRGNNLTAKKCIDLIHTAGGVAVLAHPTRYGLSEQGIYKLLKELKGEGLDGVEAIYTTYSDNEIKMMSDFAKQLNLIKTGGSDFHGLAKQKIKIGKGFKCLYVPIELYEKMLKYKTKREII